MLATGAADGHREVAALVGLESQRQPVQEGLDLRQHLHRLRLRPPVLATGSRRARSSGRKLADVVGLGRMRTSNT